MGEEQSIGPPGDPAWPAFGGAGRHVPRSQGVAGAGARREGERRRAAREARIRKEHRRTAGLRLALGQAPHHETSWTRGAEGEEHVAESLEQRVRPEVRFLWDRAMPASCANIDGIAVAPTGVWVIDAKNYKGKVEVRRRGKRDELWIKGRNETSLVEGLDRQVTVVRRTVDEFAPGVRVVGALCFLEEAGLPPLRTAFGAFKVSGHALVWRKQMARKLNRDGRLDADRISFLAEALATRFPED